jgi:hypothetical protein
MIKVQTWFAKDLVVKNVLIVGFLSPVIVGRTGLERATFYIRDFHNFLIHFKSTWSAPMHGYKSIDDRFGKGRFK